ncbi:hypothetical protein PANA5342_0628 [Pantoea ananatis LMG 5342]|nr:hypothetical protein PANA5342_0628 [Pantoea ananatis LMG 5342]
MISLFFWSKVAWLTPGMRDYNGHCASQRLTAVAKGED